MLPELTRNIRKEIEYYKCLLEILEEKKNATSAC